MLPTKFGMALALAVPLAAGALIAVAPREAEAVEACGSKENPCPLQKWMRTNLSRPSASGDMAALAAGLDKSVALVPDPAWNAGDSKVSWKAIAEMGAAAARAKDEAGVKQSCRSCHDLYKEKYRTQWRTRPVPGG